MRDDNPLKYGKRNASHRCNEACGSPEGRRQRQQSGSCCLRQLAAGRRRLAVRLAQRWVKIQVGALA